ERFQQKDLHVSGFTVTATAANEKVYNEGSAITNDTRSFISKLKVGDNIKIENIQGSYQLNGYTQIMDINYYPSITIAPNM
ncbi:MAG: hypothetical protein JWO03_3239, partial [Bacteroidetes bacterium]|nr:hypothetical protein [Bacteroidota bacterium]